MVIGPAGDELDAVRLETFGHGVHVAHHLRLVRGEVGARGLLQCDGEARDGVVMGTALEPWEDAKVDLVLQVVHDRVSFLVDTLLAFAVEDHRAARAPQGLVRRGGHHVGVIERRRDHIRGDEAGDVRHVREQKRAGGIGNLPHALVVVEAAVRAGARDEELGPVRGGQRLARVVVDQPRGFVEPVRHGLEEDGHR